MLLKPLTEIAPPPVGQFVVPTKLVVFPVNVEFEIVASTCVPTLIAAPPIVPLRTALSTNVEFEIVTIVLTLSEPETEIAAPPAFAL